MATNNTDTANESTMTAMQLFERFATAPLRIGTRSTLIAATECEYEAWDGYVGLAQPILPEELPSEIREEVSNSDDPVSELDMYIMDLEVLANGLKMMRDEFLALCEATLVDCEGDREEKRYAVPVA